MLFGWYFGIRVREGYCLVVGSRMDSYHGGGRREGFDRLSAPTRVHQPDGHGAVEVPVQPVNKTKHKTEPVSLLAHTNIIIEITNCNHKLVPSAEGVAHRAEPAAHRGRTPAVRLAHVSLLRD